MAMHDKLPIHKQAVQLLGVATTIHAQLPRGMKRTVGDKIVEHCTEMLDLMAQANATRSATRISHLRSVLTHQRAAEVWLRVGFERRAISQGRWAEAVHMLESVGKQANGWINKTSEKAPAA